MNPMFCTLKEAARALHASEDQINALLEGGLLHEFREGPHRLLKETDVGALALLQEPPAPTPPPVQTPRPSVSRRTQPKAGRPTGTKRPHSSAAVARPPRARHTEKRRPRTDDRRRTTEDGRPRIEGTGRCPDPVRPPSCVLRPSSPPPARPSVGQWFWMGLVQDRPIAIALLSGLLLLLLAALVAGLCFVAEGF